MIDESVDVLVVGSGAGGSPIALEMSKAGFEVLVLEKGPRYSRADFKNDELRTLVHPDQFVPSIEDEPHVLRHPDGRTERTTLGWIACCVGGGTAHMGGSFHRFRPGDFRLRTLCGSFEAIEDWPYGYEAIEPYYAKAELSIGVAGQDGDLTSGSRSTAYPMPPLACHWLSHQLTEAAVRIGLNLFRTPRAINSIAYDGRPGCTFCELCSGYGCPTGARGSTFETLLARAENTGRCTVRANAMAHTVVVNEAGRATGCVYLDANGTEHRVRASLICVSCSAIESARLLLHSRSAAFPSGLGNRNGLVGKNLQFQSTSFARARWRGPVAEPNDRRFLDWCSTDHYFLPRETNFFGKGGTIQFGVERPQPIADALRVALPSADRVVIGEPLKKALRDYYIRSVEPFAEIFHDFIPNSGTFAELDNAVTDKWNLPVARLHVAPPQQHKNVGTLLVNRAIEAFEALGAADATIGRLGDVNPVMVHGTCRAGNNPSTSVLNQFCQVHDVPNLFVVDGSFMPTSGGVASTLTILANSFRTADYILDQAKHGGLA